MAAQSPTFDDANLTLRLYDLRREAVMRQSRDLLNMKFWPKSYEDFIAITKPDSPMNAAFRQISSFWEMVYGMAHHGIAHAEYLVENNAEGLFFYSKIQPYVAQFRKEGSPTAFQHTEWVATNTDVGRKRVEMFTKRFAAMNAAK